jgi:copper chaperone CopZ
VRQTTWVLITLGLACAASGAEPAVTVLTVTGLGCKGCPSALEHRLAKTPGVLAGRIDARKGEATVTYDPNATDAGEVAESLQRSGFKVQLAPWEPVSASFNECSNGFCGLRRPNARVHAQPGASPGHDVYCPVSGVVVSVKDATPKDESRGKPVYVCCEGCLRYLHANRARVLALRGSGAAK